MNRYTVYSENDMSQAEFDALRVDLGLYPAGVLDVSAHTLFLHPVLARDAVLKEPTLFSALADSLSDVLYCNLHDSYLHWLQAHPHVTRNMLERAIATPGMRFLCGDCILWEQCSISLLEAFFQKFKRPELYCELSEELRAAHLSLTLSLLKNEWTLREGKETLRHIWDCIPLCWRDTVKRYTEADITLWRILMVWGIFSEVRTAMKRERAMQAHALGFCMGGQERLGQNSLVRLLPLDALQQVTETLISPQPL